MIKFIRNLLMATTVPDGEEKVKNAIAFFASEHQRLTQKPLTATSVHKYLSLLDDESLKKAGHPAFGLHFRRMGKKLTDCSERRETRNDDFFVVILQEGEYVVKATREPDLSHFSTLELVEMKKLVDLNVLRKVLHKRFSSLEADGTRRIDEVNADFLDDTREEAWAEIKNAVMDVSERSFFTKCKEVDEMTGLNLLIEKYETRLTELETQVAEIKRKLETVTEASRLLSEEGLSEDDSKPRWS